MILDGFGLLSCFVICILFYVVINGIGVKGE